MPKGAMNCEKLIFAGYTNNHRVCRIGFSALYCFSHPVSGVFFYLSIAPEGVLFYCRENYSESLYTSYFTTCRRFLEMPRKIDVTAAINRMRRAEFKKE
jgi:hypothetical protein